MRPPTAPAALREGRFTLAPSLAVAVVLALALCADCNPPARRHVSRAPGAIALSPAPMSLAASEPPPQACDAAHALTAHFYDVGQALSVLVDLPDGRHVLVDAGDTPRRCGDVCAQEHQHLLEALTRDLRGAPLDMMWITHPHSDHVGGAPDVIASVPVRAFVDNGRAADKAEVRRARDAARAAGASVLVVDPEHTESPLAPSAIARLTPIVPAAWPSSCTDDANECSIALRIDACGASILLTGDAEHEEEPLLDTRGPVTLLQVGHHGSDTSTSLAMLARARPRYAVVSAGKPDEGMNREYCHPRAAVIERLDRALGGAAGAPLEAFDGTRCEGSTSADWIAVPTSARLWATERDGDVVLTTSGDGTFRRVGAAAP